MGKRKTLVRSLPRPFTDGLQTNRFACEEEAGPWHPAGRRTIAWGLRTRPSGAGQEVDPASSLPDYAVVVHVFANLVLSNPRRDDLEAVEVRALADTGALMLCIPEHLAIQLGLEKESNREISLADGRRKSVPYVGPLRVSFRNRFCYVGALVLGDEVLMGAVPMEDMDLVVHPGRRELTVDPMSPNVPHSRVKRSRYTSDEAG